MVNGAVLHYEERGSGPPLLLVHGTGAYADIWSPVLDGLARAYRVIAYDRRGFARSSPAPHGGLAEHARDAAALLKALGASPATVVGWSGGGVFALDLAASFPDCVAALILAEPAVHLTTHPTRGALAMAVRSGFHRYVRRDPASAALEMYRWASGYKTGGNAFDALPEAWRAQMLANAPTTLREMDQMIRPYPHASGDPLDHVPSDDHRGRPQRPGVCEGRWVRHELVAPGADGLAARCRAHAPHRPAGELGRCRHSDDRPRAIARGRAKPPPAIMA